MNEVTDRWVLVVEDNPDDELLARRAFASPTRSERLVVARDGVEALDILRSQALPVLVLLDLKLPRLSGVEVLMEMNDDRRLRAIPVVVLTSSREISDIAACYELGCSAYVEKPLDFNAFISNLGTMLDFWLDINLTLPAVHPETYTGALQATID